MERKLQTTGSQQLCSRQEEVEAGTKEHDLDVRSAFARDLAAFGIVQSLTSKKAAASCD